MWYVVLINVIKIGGAYKHRNLNITLHIHQSE